jgi:hypothetical protein
MQPDDGTEEKLGKSKTGVVWSDISLKHFSC